jgi:hypothetical protein
MRLSSPYSGAATEGPQAVFGRVYQTLEFYREDEAYDPLRDIVGDFIQTRFPVVTVSSNVRFAPEAAAP